MRDRKKGTASFLSKFAIELRAQQWLNKLQIWILNLKEKKRNWQFSKAMNSFFTVAIFLVDMKSRYLSDDSAGRWLFILLPRCLVQKQTVPSLESWHFIGIYSNSTSCNSVMDVRWQPLRTQGKICRLLAMTPYLPFNPAKEGFWIVWNIRWCYLNEISTFPNESYPLIISWWSKRIFNSVFLSSNSVTSIMAADVL